MLYIGVRDWICIHKNCCHDESNDLKEDKLILSSLKWNFTLFGPPCVKLPYLCHGNGSPTYTRA